MTQTITSWFSESDQDQVLDLVPQLEASLNEKEVQNLEQLEKEHGRKSEEYLNAVITLYKKYLLHVFEKQDSPRRERGHGGRKIGGHSEGKHR